MISINGKEHGNCYVVIRYVLGFRLWLLLVSVVQSLLCTTSITIKFNFTRGSPPGFGSLLGGSAYLLKTLVYPLIREKKKEKDMEHEIEIGII